MRSVLHRYQTDARFHALCQIIEKLILDTEGDFTTGEVRDAFTMALQRIELTRTRPLMSVPEDQP